MVRAVQVASGAGARTAGRAPDTARPGDLNLLSRGRERLGGFEAFGPGKGVDHECGRISPPQNSRRVAANRRRGRRDLVAPGLRADRPALGRRRLLHPGHLAGARRGYRLLSEPGSTESNLHPPFLPALVATYQTVLQTSDPVVVGHALRLTAALISVAYAIAIFVLLSAYIPRTYALAAALIAVLQPQFAYFSDSLYAETFFGLFTVLFFILQRYRASTVCFFLSGSCAVLAYEARTAGIALLAAWVAESLLLRDYKRAAIAFVISIVPVVSWIAWIKAVESSPEYQQPAYAYQRAPYVYFNVSYARNLMTLADPSTPELGPLTTAVLFDRLRSNVKALPVSIGRAVSGWEAPERVALPLAFLVLIGMILQARRKQYLMLMYVALSLAAVCLTPFQKQFVRYLMPLYPFFALALFQLLAKLAREPGFPARLVPSFARAVPVWIVVAIIGYQEFDDLRNLYGLSHHDAAYEQRGQLVEYKLFYYVPLGTAFDQALDWQNGVGTCRRHRCDRSAVGVSQDGEKGGASALRAEWQDGTAADRHRAGEIPDRRKQAGAARAGARTTDSLRPCCARTLLRGTVCGAVLRAVSRSISEPVHGDSRLGKPILRA